MFTLDSAFAGAALALAVASPIVTAIINSHTQKREREAVFFLQHRAEIFENYVKCTGRYIRQKSPDNSASYGAAYGEILLYLPPALAEEVTKLDSHITKGMSADPSEIKQFNAVCEKLSQYAPRIKGKKRNRVAK